MNSLIWQDTLLLVVLACHRNTALPEVTESIKYNDVNIPPGSWGKLVVLKISLTSVFSCVDRITGLGAQLTTVGTAGLWAQLTTVGTLVTFPAA